MYLFYSGMARALTTHEWDALCIEKPKFCCYKIMLCCEQKCVPLFLRPLRKTIPNNFIHDVLLMFLTIDTARKFYKIANYI
jgi:hypothetical protein